MRWSTSNKFDYTGMIEGDDKMPDVGEWFSIQLLSFIAGLVGVLRGNYPINLFMHPKHFAQLRFYVNRFSPDYEEVLYSIETVILFF